MITSFATEGTKDIFDGTNSKAARKTLPRDLWTVAVRKLDMLNAAKELVDLTVPPANNLEKLKGDLDGKYSIRINDQFRVIFDWAPGSASNVYIDDYH